jgi:hypothetical protein
MEKSKRPHATSDAIGDIVVERVRQQTKEGWTPEHDDQHTDGELGDAAVCYALKEIPDAFVPVLWPWDREWFKPTDRRRNLVKAGALILAEIERLDRMEEE